MTPPPPYPRTPYLWRDDGSQANLIPFAEQRAWFTEPVVVEEKLDGANVSIWLEDGRVRVASRGGGDAMDRAGQLGRLRAWTTEHDSALRRMLTGDVAAYGEWLWLEHTVHYDSLPSWLVLLDLYTPAEGLLDAGQRDRAAADAGVVIPPRLFEGVLGGRKTIAELMGRSRFGSQPMEGVILRRHTGERCKVVRTGFRPKPDAAWNGRTTNSLRP